MKRVVIPEVCYRRMFQMLVGLTLMSAMAACGGSAAVPTAVPTATSITFVGYEAEVLPILDRSVVLFRRASSEVGKVANVADIAGACQSHRSSYDKLRIQFDSIPRIGPWYTASGVLHRRVMGVYHLMLGTVDACQLASDNGDSAGVRTMKRDMRTQTAAITRLRDKVRRQVNAH